MASKVTVKMNIPGFYQLRREPGVVADLVARGKRVQSVASSDGGTYVMGSRQGAKRPQGRWRVDVATGDYRTRVKNRKHNSLMRGLNAAR